MCMFIYIRYSSTLFHFLRSFDIFYVRRSDNCTTAAATTAEVSSTTERVMTNEITSTENAAVNATRRANESSQQGRAQKKKQNSKNKNKVFVIPQLFLSVLAISVL